MYAHISPIFMTKLMDYCDKYIIEIHLTIYFWTILISLGNGKATVNIVDSYGRQKS
jgi:hypothetical protein